MYLLSEKRREKREKRRDIVSPVGDGFYGVGTFRRRLTSGLREEWLGNAACAADKREERREKRAEILCRLSAMDFMVWERSGGD